MRWSVSNLFLVPLLNVGRNRLDRHGFINSYMFNQEEALEYESALHLLFMPPDMVDFNDFLEEERERRAVILDEHDYPGGYILLSYELPKRFKRDYQLIMEGRFSETSAAYKNAIPAVVKAKENNIIKSQTSLQHMVFNKDVELRHSWEKMLDVTLHEDQELWSKPVIDKETFKISIYDELSSTGIRRPTAKRD